MDKISAVGAGVSIVLDEVLAPIPRPQKSLAPPFAWEMASRQVSKSVNYPKKRFAPIDHACKQALTVEPFTNKRGRPF